MKNAAILAIILGVLGNAANAESAVNEAPNLTLALNTSITERWIEPAGAPLNKAASQTELEALDKALEEISNKLNKQLEDKIAKEFEYAMH